MKITVKPLKGDNFEVEADPSMTIDGLKNVIATAKSDYPADLQKLIFSGRILKDESTVAELNIKPTEFIVVMLTKAKAPTAAPTPSPTPAAPTPTAPTSAQSGPAAEDTAGAAAANVVTGSGMESTISMLCDMGFPREEVVRCMAAAFNNPDRAVEYLTNGIPEGILAQAQGGGGGGGAPPTPTPTPAPATGGGAAPFPAVPQGGGGGNAFPAMPTGGGSGGGDGPLPPALQELRNNPQFAQMAGMIAQNPQMLAQMLPALGQTNPELVQVISENPQAFMRMIQEAATGGGAQETDPVAAMLNAAGVGPGGGSGGGAPPGTTVIRLTEEERAAVDRLAALGFDRNTAAQAYLACDKNEELAANLLFDGGDDMMTD